MAKIHTLQRELVINTDRQTAWRFISSPQNLDAITPPDMNFEIITEVPDVMYDGLLIEYRVGIPLLGKQSWLSEIKHIVEGHSFVDEQLAGPYKLWFHYHEIAEVDAGIRFTDRVTYVIPMGPLGGIAHALYVKKQLKHIFDYREEAMVRHFSSGG